VPALPVAPRRPRSHKNLYLTAEAYAGAQWNPRARPGPGLVPDTVRNQPEQAARRENRP